MIGRRHILTRAILLVCLALLPAAVSFGDAKADKEAAKRAKEEQAAQKRAERDAERARTQAERQRVEQDRQARREAERQRRQQTGGGRDSGNESIQTQRETADAMAERRRLSEEKEKDSASRRRPTTAPVEPEKTEAGDDALAEIQQQIQEEDQRHAAMTSRYRRAADVARRAGDSKGARDAETALSRENDGYRRTMAGFTKRRDALMKQPAKDTAKETPTTPAKERPKETRARL